MDAPARPDDGPVEQALRELLAPLDRNLERGRTVLAAALVLAPAPFILLWLLSQIEAKTAAGWSVLAFGVLVLAGLGWETLAARFIRWRFDRRFPTGSPTRSMALHVLGEIETLSRVEEKLLDSLGDVKEGVVRHRPGATQEPPLPLLELPPQTPEPRPTTAPQAPAASRPGGYYDYIPLEPLGNDEAGGSGASGAT